MRTICVSLASLAAVVLAGAEVKVTEDALIAILKSEASVKEKADACRELALVGTRKAVPALVALLKDEKLSHMSRYALEPIPDPAVDAALRAALGELEGRALAGAIGSIGVRRDTTATASLVALLRSADADVAQAAARALGSFGTLPAAEGLVSALPGAPAGQQLALAEGLLRYAEALVREGKRTEAAAIYDRLRELEGAAPQVRTAALRGAVLMRGDAGLPALLEALRGRDRALVGAAALTSLEMPGAAVTAALSGELATLRPDSQVLVVSALGKRGDKAAVPALCAIAKTGGSRAARQATVRALVEIGAASAVPVLIALMGDEAEEVARAAQDALAGMEGPEIETALVAMLDEQDPKARGVAIELLGRRRATGAIPGLLKAAATGDESNRIASIKALGGMAGSAEFPALVGLLTKATSAPELQALEAAVSQVCVRHTRAQAGDVVIRSATYGDLPNGPKADVTAKLSEIVTGGALDVEASNTVFGDPAPSTPKKLRVEYTVRGQAKTDTVNEGATLRIVGGATPPAFIDALRAAAEEAPPEPKQALLRVLAATGAPAR